MFSFSRVTCRSSAHPCEFLIAAASMSHHPPGEGVNHAVTQLSRALRARAGTRLRDQRIGRAGLPTIRLPAGALRMTLLPRPTNVPSPISRPFMMLLPLPM